MWLRHPGRTDHCRSELPSRPLECRSNRWRRKKGTSQNIEGIQQDDSDANDDVTYADADISMMIITEAYQVHDGQGAEVDSQDHIER